MVRMFECWECHKNFEADDKEWVECPHCHSDNVEYATWHMPKYTQKTIAATVVVGIVVTGAYYGYNKFNSEKEVVDVPEITPIVIGEDTITVTDYEGEQTPILSIKNGIPEFDGEAYSFEMVVEFPPKGDYKFLLLDAFDDKKVIATSDDGKFEDIPFSENEGGSYRVKLVSADGNVDLCQAIPVSGFIKQVKVAKKMTVAEIQTLLDNEDPSLLGVGENDYLAPDLKLKYQGLPSDVINIPKTLGEVNADKITMGLWIVKVVKLEYDEYNRISVITLKVTDNSLDF